MSPDGAYEFVPRLWALVGFFVVSALVIGLLVALLGLSPFIVVVAPVGGTWVFGRSARVTLDRSGVRFGSSSCRWADIEMRTSRIGVSLRSKPGVDRKSRLVVFLPMYLADWEAHPVRNDVRRWAPHLSLSL